MNPVVQHFFDQSTSTLSYVVYEAPGSKAIVIVSVLNYDSKSGRTATIAADQMVRFVKEHRLQVELILETHAHADHFSAAPYMKQQLGGRIAIGSQIKVVQQTFKHIFNLGQDFVVDGSQFDYLLNADEKISFGALSFKALFVPGHTPACMAYEIGDAIFVGDTLFMPDVGSARCDFPGGDAQQLYRSARTILSRPPKTRLFMCHDNPPNDRPKAYETTVGAQQQGNIHLRDGISEQQFVTMRFTRDQTLEMPVLILPAIQVNIRAGYLPPVEDNGIAYIKIPLNTL